MCEERFLLTNYLVNSAADSNTGTGNNGTLRYVLNQLPITGTATNTIDFQIGSVGTLATITLTSDLPPIGRQVTINGYLPGGGATGPTNTVILIQLNLNGNNGLVFNPGSDNSSVQGLSIYGGGIGNSSSGIDIDANNVRSQGTSWGSRPDLTKSPNATGILITGSNNTISGANVISANVIGIDISGAGATGNVVSGNFIGTNASGANLGNTGDGVLIDGRAYQQHDRPGQHHRFQRHRHRIRRPA